VGHDVLYHGALCLSLSFPAEAKKKSEKEKRQPPLMSDRRKKIEPELALRF
jgi:hypothetical protein